MFECGTELWSVRQAVMLLQHVCSAVHALACACWPAGLFQALPQLPEKVCRGPDTQQLSEDGAVVLLRLLQAQHSKLGC